MSISLNWGILGTGNIARKFASELPHSATGRLVAVGSRSEESARRFVAEFPSVRAHGSYSELLADPEVQAVYLAMPHPEHAEWAIAAAEAGKHILCEKPLTMNHPDAMVVVEAARRNGVFLMEAFMYRCHPRTAKLVELVREGAVGKISLIRASFSFAAGWNPEGRLFSNALGGGGILDVGCYTVSIARLLAGAAAGIPFANPEDVQGCANLCETGVDTVAAATLKFPGGLLAQLSCGIRLRQAHDLEVFGETGSLRMPAFWNPPGPIEILDYESGKTTVIPAGGGDYKYAVEADVVAAALPGHECSAMSWNDTLGNMLTLDLWRKAAGVTYESEQPGAPQRGLPLSQRPLVASRFLEIPRIQLPGLDRPVARLLLGVDNQRTLPQMAAMADDYMERGGNAFDTAFLYGGGLMEEMLGHWQKSRGVREEIVIVAKGAHTPNCNPVALREQIEMSLQRLRTDYADLYFMHRDNPDVPVGEFVDVLDALRNEGKIRQYGGSNWTMERLAEANAYAARTGKEPFRLVSNNLSLARMVNPVWRGCVSSKGPEWRDFLQTNDLALFAWSSQARGYFVPGRDLNDPELLRCWDSSDNRERRVRANQLAEQYNLEPVNIALAYVLSQPVRTFALFGPRTISETRSSLGGADLVLSAAELAWLDLETDQVS